MKNREGQPKFEANIAGVKSQTKLCDLTVGQFVKLVSLLSQQNANRMPDKKAFGAALENVRSVIAEQKGHAQELKDIVGSARTAILENIGKVATAASGEARDAGPSPYGRS